MREFLGKESFKNPSFCLKVFLTVILFGGLILGSNAALKFLPLKEFSFLTASSANSFSSQEVFAEPIKNFLEDSPDVVFLQENSIIGYAPPAIISQQVLGSLNSSSLETRREITEYMVKEGDTLSSLAEKFNISLKTILWANDLNSKSVIQPGQELIILPVSGLVYHIKKGDTLGKIAEVYKGKVDEIVAFNELANRDDVFVGDILIIPGGEIPKITTQYVRKPEKTPIASSYFICPHSACKISQGLHWYNAIDFDGECGDPLHAVAEGTVQRVRYGWNGGAGNYITILHPNGVVTMYGHIQKSLVGPGQHVSQGKTIALMGGKPGMPGCGISTGCHVHFDVRGAENPFAK